MADEPAKTLRLLADLDELALTWFRYAAGERGPELHIHERHTDAFFVLTGELSVALGPEGAHEVAATRERSSRRRPVSRTRSPTRPPRT